MHVAMWSGYNKVGFKFCWRNNCAGNQVFVLLFVPLCVPCLCCPVYVVVYVLLCVVVCCCVMLCVGFLFGFVRKSTPTRRAALMAIGRKKFNFFTAFEQLENWRIDGEQLASVECRVRGAREGQD